MIFVVYMILRILSGNWKKELTYSNELRNMWMAYHSINQRVITLEYRMAFLYNETKIALDYFPAVKAGMKGRRNGKNRDCETYD